MGRFFRWWLGRSLVLRIVCGLVIGVVLALLLPGWKFIGVFGTLFVGALKAIAPVLVAVLVTSSLAGAGEGLGPRFRTVAFLYVFSTLMAALTAVVAFSLFPVSLSLAAGSAASEAGAVGGLGEVFYDLLVRMVSNPVAALASGNYICILFWSVLLGLSFKAVAGEKVIRGMKTASDSFSHVVRWIIQFAPLGVMGLVFTSVSENGLGIFAEYGRLILVLVGCMLLVAFVINPLISMAFTRSNPWPLMWTCAKESGVSAFFTRSSAANIPVNLDLCERLGLDRNFYSVSIPLGATVNMNGAAVTITVMSLATAASLGQDVSLAQALLLCPIAALGACGASGVAGGSLLLVPLGCSMFGISADVAMQAVSIGFIISVIQDSVETALNSSGDAFFTATAELFARRKARG